ncbi:MAG: MogA/MoaB family molybdenum cofactor biosynthesis protein [Candidatus Omnitrophota bacterium]
MLEVAVITISDRAYSGEYEDRSGPIIMDLLEKSPLDVHVTRDVVPDDEKMIRTAILQHSDKDYILTTGGTGISPRDITPEVTEELCEKELPGVSEMLRFESFKETRFAAFSRGYCGIRGNTIMVNFPGSVKAVTLCTTLFIPLMEHGIQMLHGEKH